MEWCQWPRLVLTVQDIFLLNTLTISAYYSATTRTRPLGTKLTNHKVNWEQWKATFLVNGPMTCKNTDNSFTTKFENRQLCKKVWTAQKICPYSDWLVSILNFEEHLKRFQFSSSFQITTCKFSEFENSDSPSRSGLVLQRWRRH